MGLATAGAQCTIGFYLEFENELYDLVNLPGFYTYWSMY